nr:retrovirus-related Pol polyprotein from transposon TNT 1-94 [Tanacetum cinerariifolium]
MTTRHKGKEIAKPITPPSETTFEEDSDPEQAQRDKDMQKNLALIAKYFKKIYKPTNNNLRTSLNSKNKNVDMTLRYKNDDHSGKFGNQRTVNATAARENVRSKVVQQSGIQCFNCKEYGNFSKECRKPKRVKESAYHKEKMLLCKQAEQGVPLQAEQYDWLADTDEEIDKQELEAHYSYMAKIQEVPTADSGTDSELVEQIQKQLKKANTLLAQELKECKAILAKTSMYIGEFEKFKAFNDHTIDYDKLKRKLNDALGQLAHKDTVIKEDLFRAPTAHDMEILIQTCLMPLAFKTQSDSLKFVHELKQEMHADLKYVESLEKEIDELESEKAEFSDMYDVILQECVSKDVMCSYLQNLSDLDALAELQCMYLHKVKECDCLAQRLSKQTEYVSKKHMTGNLKLLCNFVEKSMGTLHFGNDQFAPILGYEDLVQGNVTINRVYYVEGLNHNLFSVGQFCDADLKIAFRKSTCFVRDLQEFTSSTPLYLMAKATPTQAWLWHRRLYHLNFDYINLLSKKDIVIGLPKLKYVKDQLCLSCELSKAKRRPFKSKVVPSSKGRLNLLHMDLCGPMRVASINGKKYIMVIVDDYSRYVVPTGRVIDPTSRVIVATGSFQMVGSDNESDNASVHNETANTQQQPNIQPQIITTVLNNNAKFHYLKKDEYEVWAMKMDYWITNNDMNIWKVIQNGNSLKRTRRDLDGRSIPDDHVVDFHYMDDARDIWNAVKVRFGGNAESKKMRKSMPKQEFLEFRTGDAGEFALMGVTSEAHNCPFGCDNKYNELKKHDKSSEVNTNDFPSNDSSVKSSEHQPNDSTSCASTSSVSTSVNEVEIESNVRTPIKEPIIVQDLPSFTCNSSDKNEHNCRTSCNKNGYVNKKAGHFRKNASFVFKLCFICGSGTHLIKDYDLYEKQMSNKTVGIGVGSVHSRNGVHHNNQSIPQVVLLQTGKVNIPPARP